MRAVLLFALATAVALPAAVQARDALGVFGEWAAFRDPETPRCYAITAAEERQGQSHEQDGFASVGTWPDKRVRGQLHVRMTRELAKNSWIVLSIRGKSFSLIGGGSEAWAKDAQMDAAIVAAMRSGGDMTVTALDAKGRRFFDRFSLDGAPTALDAATLGCSGRR
tara:strand:+ start:709 stop:1206 length:498 start_codon:yes stop_codon:yes gene_type:complete